MWERNAVGAVECSEVYLADTDAEDDGYQSPQELAVLAWIEFGRRQCIVAIDLLVVVEDNPVVYLPDEVVRGTGAIPLLEDVPDAESAVMLGEEASRALQL